MKYFYSFYHFSTLIWCGCFKSFLLEHKGISIIISVTKWSIVGYLSDAKWDLWDGSIHTYRGYTKPSTSWRMAWRAHGGASGIHGNGDWWGTSTRLATRVQWTLTLWRLNWNALQLCHTCIMMSQITGNSPVYSTAQQQQNPSKFCIIDLF